MGAIGLWAAVAVLVALSACGAATERATPPGTVLLTGFDPFGGRDVNESWEAVRVLDGTTVGGRRIVARKLPVVYDEMAAPLLAAIAETRPQAVISFGVGTEVVQVETVARNAYHAQRPLDNAGKPPPRAAIEPDGPATVPTGLPVARILEALARVNVPARTSEDAGGYLCNECFFRLVRAEGAAVAGVRARGFVHVPPAGAPNPAGGAFDLATIRRGVRAVVEATIASLDDAPNAR